jgi:cytochrome c oxidase subunit 2
VFGRIDRTLVKTAGDPCIDPDDPNGWDDFVFGTLRVPVKKPVIVQVTSTDVIHAYAIVPMRIQQDAIPGVDIPMWFRPMKELETSVVCAQLCGPGHGDMKGEMEVIGAGAYKSWVTEQSNAAREQNRPKPDAGDDAVARR